VEDKMRAIVIGLIVTILAPAPMALAAERADARLCEAYKYLTIVGLPAGDEEIRHAADAVARANCAAMLRKQNQNTRPSTQMPPPRDGACPNCGVHNQ
jgi:hypothetical protein